jgi:hypothetical protein
MVKRGLSPPSSRSPSLYYLVNQNLGFVKPRLSIELLAWWNTEMMRVMATEKLLLEFEPVENVQSTVLGTP